MDERPQERGPDAPTDALDQGGVEETLAETAPAATAPEPELAQHPGPKQYVGIAAILAVVTALEVGLYYIDLVRAVFIGLLLFLAVVKFSLVVLWFMHLRFDSRIFQRLFVTGMILAISVYLIVLTISRALPAAVLVGLAAFLVGMPLALYLLRRRTQPAFPPEKETAVGAAAHG